VRLILRFGRWPLAKWNSVPLTLIDAEGVRHWHTGLGTKTPTKTAHAAETATRARQSAVIFHQTARQVRTGIENGTPARVLTSVDDARKYDPDAASR
jgi:hypothetical protein